MARHSDLGVLRLSLVCLLVCCVGFSSVCDAVGARLLVRKARSAAPATNDEPDAPPAPPGPNVNDQQTHVDGPSYTLSTENPLGMLRQEPDKEQYQDETLDMFLKRILPKTEDITGLTVSKTPNSIAIVSNDNIVLNPRSPKEQKFKQVTQEKHQKKEMAAKKVDEGKLKREHETQAKKMVEGDEKAQQKLQLHKARLEAELEGNKKAADAAIAQEEEQQSKKEDGYLCDCQEVAFNLHSDWTDCPPGKLLHALHRINRMGQGIAFDNIYALDTAKCCSPCRRDKTILEVKRCEVANWWLTFDAPGWSRCPPNTFMQGINRNKNGCKELYCIEAVRCCYIEGSREQRHCAEANWWGSMDSPGWSELPFSQLATGFMRTHNHFLHNLETVWACGFSAY